MKLITVLQLNSLVYRCCVDSFPCVVSTYRNDHPSSAVGCLNIVVLTPSPFQSPKNRSYGVHVVTRIQRVVASIDSLRSCVSTCTFRIPITIPHNLLSVMPLFVPEGSQDLRPLGIPACAVLEWYSFPRNSLHPPIRLLRPCAVQQEASQSQGTRR